MTNSKTNTVEQADLPIITTEVAVRLIMSHYEANKPMLLWGPPGAGKTSAVREAGVKLGEMIKKGMIVRHVTDRYESVTEKEDDGEQSPATSTTSMKEGFTVKEAFLSRMTPADVGGLPAIDRETKRTTFYLPDLLTDLPTKHGILFFDELTTADPQTRAAVMNLILEGRLGKFQLPDGWFCVAAANPKEWGGLYGDLMPAMNNRFSQYQVEPSMTEWVNDWAPRNGINPVITAFFRNTGGPEFNTSSEQMSKNPKLFPTPRSWAAVSNILDTVKDQSLRETMIKGTVGFRSATAFIQFMKTTDDLRDIEVYLEATAEPKRLEKIMPTKIGSLYVLACAMPLYVTDSKNGKDVKAAMRNNQVYSLLTQMYFAKDTWGENFASTPIREIAVVGWELAGTKALSVDIPAIVKNPDFTRYNEHRAAFVGKR